MNFRINSSRQLMIIIALFTGVVLVSCFAPRYSWHYWLPDKSNAKLHLGKYEIILRVVAAKTHQDLYKDLPSNCIRYSIQFNTYYRDSISNQLNLDSLPSLVIDSTYIIKMPNSQMQFLELYHKHMLAAYDTTRFYKLRGEWIGMTFGGGFDLNKNQEDLTIGFKALLIDNVLNDTLENKPCEFHLRRFYDRSWIIAD